MLSGMKELILFKPVIITDLFNMALTTYHFPLSNSCAKFCHFWDHPAMKHCLGLGMKIQR